MNQSERDLKSNLEQIELSTGSRLKSLAVDLAEKLRFYQYEEEKLRFSLWEEMLLRTL